MVRRHTLIAGLIVAGAGVLAACGLGDAAQPNMGYGSNDTDEGHGSSGKPGGPGTTTDPNCPTAPACKEVALPPTAHALRLTHSQWENSARDLLRLDAAPGLSVAFPNDPAAPPDKYARDAGSLVVSGALWQEYQRAAEALATLVTGDATMLDRILPAGAKAGAGDTTARFTAFATDFLRRAYRRPATAQEIASAVSLGDAITASDASPDPFTVRVKWLVSAALQSPFFLYRVEGGDGPVTNGRARLGAYEVASRLSYALWGTMPDETLFGHARSGKLNTSAGVAEVAKAMLADARAKASLMDFHEQLFGVASFQSVTRQTSVYPKYYPQIGADAQEDVRRTVSELVIDGAGGVKDLYTSKKVYVNSRLAAIYGMSTDGLDENTFVARELDGKSGRVGVLSHVGWLAWQGHAKDPASIQRGAFMARHVLCIPLGAPPPAAAGKDPSQYDGKTNRARIDAMTQCGPACHTKTINPLGFGFEHFDALGMYRDQDTGLPIDASGSNTELGTFDGVPEMMAAVVASSRVHACYAAHWGAYLSGLSEVDIESKWLGPVLTHSKSGASVREIITDLVQTDLFLTVSR